jgi:hypothetical protein
MIGLSTWRRNKPKQTLNKVNKKKKNTKRQFQEKNYEETLPEFPSNQQLSDG